MKPSAFLLSCLIGIGLVTNIQRDLPLAQSVPSGVPPTYRFENGLWFDGNTYRPQTFYSVKGVLTRKAPKTLDATLDLKGGYVTPPFGDAHCHHFDGKFNITSLTEAYFRDGIFYAQTQANSHIGAAEVGTWVNVPTGVDVRYAHACLTGNNSHPILTYEGIALGYYTVPEQNAHRAEIMKNRKRENECYVIVDTKADLERKWAQILAHKPDLIKVILLHSENYERTKEGINPKVLPLIVKKAHAAGLRVSAHIDSAADFRNALAAGVDMMAHLCGYFIADSEDLAAFQLTPDDAKLAAHRGVAVIPTANRIEIALSDANRDRTKANFIENLKLLKHYGVKFGIGTDSYGTDSQPEAFYLSKMGVWSNLELLKIWCEDTPRLIFPKRKIGLLREGYEASFVVLDKNPLEKFENAATVRFAFKQGIVLPLPSK